MPTFAGKNKQVTNQSNTSNDIQSSSAFTVQAPDQSDLLPHNISVPSTISSGLFFSACGDLRDLHSFPTRRSSDLVVRINQSPTSAAGPNLASIGTSALAAGSSV